jgi:soluble lytic murein transglycosylase
LVVMLCFTLSYERYGPYIPLSKRLAKEKVVTQIVQHIKNENGRLTEDNARSISRAVYEESERYALDYRLVLAVMKVESNFSHKAVSSKGARGLLQIKPSLAKYIASDVGIEWQGARTLDEPDKNVKIGVHLLSGLIGNSENLHMALHAYNMGPTRLKEVMGNRPKPNRGFSKIVLEEYDRNVSTLPEP